jgi:hypothetical protein
VINKTVKLADDSGSFSLGKIKRANPAWVNPLILLGVPTGSRTPVAGVKGRCPRPLDDGDAI